MRNLFFIQLKSKEDWRISPIERKKLQEEQIRNNKLTIIGQGSIFHWLIIDLWKKLLVCPIIDYFNFEKVI